MALDLGYLSTYLQVVEPNLQAALDTPTTELVADILKAITARAKEHREVQADKLRVEVELENAVRSAENKTSALRATVDKALRDVEDLRKELVSEESNRSILESELERAKSSSTTSSTELDTLKARIVTLEAANRETVAVVELKATTIESLSQDLQRQHQKSLELALQVASLQQSLQTANSANSSAKFREQSLKQELEQAKRNNDWLETELQTKSAEALKFRKDKGLRIADLQRQYDESNATTDSLKRTDQFLRLKLDEVQKKAEDSLAKIHQLQEAATNAEESFRQELESSSRLADLQAQQADTHRSRLKEVESSFEKLRNNAMEEINRGQQELEQERQGRDRLESRIADLEAENDRLANQTSQAFPSSMPGTPRQAVAGSFHGRSGSPFGTPSLTRGHSSVTATQAIDELYKVKSQLSAEKRRNERLSSEMEEIMQGLEAKQPEIEELQAEHARLQREVVEMSKFVDQTGKERERAKKDARRAEGEAATSQAEAHILEQQLRDLSAQVKLLVFHLDARDRGLESLDDAERVHLERLARGEIEGGEVLASTDTDRFISQHLVVFRSISELQQKNQELLKITRQLGAQMESDEALNAKRQAAMDHDQVQNLERRIETYKDELESMVTRSESYIRERDMFRRMLQHRGQLAVGSDAASLFGQSVDGVGFENGNEQSLNSKDNANYAALLKELQSHFDQYRDEQIIDHRSMRQQNERLSTEKSVLQSEIAKTTSQLSFATERYEMLQANYDMLKNENGELQKRSNRLSENAAKQDLRTQQVAEDLVEARGLLESMRNEVANLKAEKRLWRDVQDRLNEDNQSLLNERTRLNELVTTQQVLQNEKDLTEADSRRQVQVQKEALEIELNTVKRRLSEEMEEGKRLQLRKEYDIQQNQRRIDDLVTSLGSAREELVIAKTTRDHLQARVEEVVIELKSAEERVGVMQLHPTPHSGRAPTENATDDSITRQQELLMEISELRRDLEISKAEAEGAKSQMEQYKAISQSAEEELQSLNETQDEYRQEMDRMSEERDQQARLLRQRVDDVSAELSKSNDELSKVYTEHSEIQRRMDMDKTSLEEEIRRLRDEDERHATAARFHQQDLRVQAEIASKAQQDYENELVKHASAAKLLQTLRHEYNVLKTDSLELKNEAESAKDALRQSQTSWDERHEQFERELIDMRSRRDDMAAQNKLLLEQLENVSNEVAELQRRRHNSGDHQDLENASAATENRPVESLRELVKYLRRDKEIVDVQYELSLQEAKRLRQQLDYTQSHLDEARLKLDQERRAQADGLRSSMNHKDLMERINELNTYRESTVTLRNELRQTQSDFADKTKQTEALLADIQPLQTKINELESLKEVQEGELRLLQEDRDRWQKRNQEILSKYDRIDPAELEQLRDNITALQAERDALVIERDTLVKRMSEVENQTVLLQEAFDGERTTWQQTRQKIIDQAKEKNRQHIKDKNDRAAERDAAIAEKESLNQQLAGVRSELEVVQQRKQKTEEDLSAVQSELANVKSNSQSETSAAERTATASPSGVTAAMDPTSEPADSSEELDALRTQLVAVKRELDVARDECAKAYSERDQAVTHAAELQKTNEATMQNLASKSSTEDGELPETVESTMPEAEKKALGDRVNLAESRVREVEASIESTLKQRSQKMREQLNQKLKESKAALEAEFRNKLEQEKISWQATSVAEASQGASTSVLGSPATGQRSPKEASPNEPGTQPSRTAAEVGKDLSGLPDTDIREIILSNSVVKSILSSNIRSKLDPEKQKVREEMEKKNDQEKQKIREEIEQLTSQRLLEAEKKAEDTKAQAVMMEGRKSALKLNMADNQKRTALAKLQVVEKAAQDTPAKPVKEVWDIAKDAKAAAVVAPVNASAPQQSRIDIPEQDRISPALPASGIASASAPGLPRTSTTSGPATTAIPVVVATAGPKSAIPQLSAQNVIPVQQNGTVATTPSNGLASGPSQPSAAPRTNLPIPNRGGGTARGSRGGMVQARGVGVARGRGGSQRGGGNLNPSVSNLSPNTGSKRPHEDIQGQAAQQATGQKRLRGGGPVS